VIGVAHALGATRLTREQRNMLTLMESSARTLESVLSDLLDLARIESGKLDLQQARFSLGEVVREAAALWRMEAEQKGLKLSIDIAADAEGAVEGDPVRLRQIVVNLLSNAVKFTEAGRVGLTVSRRADAPERVVIEVADTGVGFEPEIAERLFERFEQADGSYTRRFGGRAWGWRSAATLPAAWAGPSPPGANPAWAPPSMSSCRWRRWLLRTSKRARLSPPAARPRQRAGRCGCWRPRTTRSTARSWNTFSSRRALN
jgi:hypothetical protein